MSTNITRRDLLKLAGGSFLGIMFTPVPWKLLNDSAIWTQNWSLIPQLPRGPISIRYSTCTLCPGGCGLKARCVNGVPFGLAGIPGHPVSNGMLCPVGLTGHHYSYHPLRLLEPCKFSGKHGDSELAVSSLDDVVAAIARELRSARTNGTVAVLDQRPGRAVSALYQEFLSQFPTSSYLVPPSQEGSTLTTLQGMSSEPATFGFDFENSKVILSFGAPLLDGWGTPGRIQHIFNSRKQNGVKLIQAESLQSRTALQADAWLPLKPGTETVLALGLVNVILSEGLYPATSQNAIKDFSILQEVASRYPVSRAAEITGLTGQQITDTAHAIAQGPSAIVAGCDPGAGPLPKEADVAIASLNVLLGNVGKPGGIVHRSEHAGVGKSHTQIQSIADVPDHSIRVLIIDASESGYAFPWSLIEKKLVPEKGIVVSLSPYMTPVSAFADYLVPAPAHLESIEEAATPNGAAVSSMSLSMPLIAKSAKSVDPVEFMKKIAEAAGTSVSAASSEDLLKQRVQAIHASKQGWVFSAVNGKSTKVSEIASADDMWKSLADGGCWTGEQATAKQRGKFTVLTAEVRQRLERQAPTQPLLALTPTGWKSATSSAAASPLMSKTFQESGLRNSAGRAMLNPATARAHGLAEADAAIVQTANGTLRVTVHVDATVMADIVVVAAGPSPNRSETVDHTNNDGVLSVCAVSDDGTWRYTEATIAKA